LLAAVPVVSAGTVPETMSYQGRLTDAAGVPVSGTVEIAFSLYTVAEETEPPTAALWAETHSVTVDRGLFTVVLGASTIDPHPLTLPFDRPYYLGIRVGSDPALTPRQALTGVPYALRAKAADSVAVGAVRSDMIARAAVTRAKLTTTCALGQVLRKTVSGWACGPSPY
jgi:hypothetical protein